VLERCRRIPTARWPRQQLPPDKNISAQNLRLILAAGGSVWTVSPDNRSLQRAVDPQTQAAFELTTSFADVASNELREAWANAYGRQPDPSDAWDHSIKAVEAVLRPIVCPNNTKATLSNVIGELRAQPWTLMLRGRVRDHNVQPLIEMLDLMWPDPNRHGSPSPEPPATLEEARAVVQLAVTVVQWARDGQIVTKSLTSSAPTSSAEMVRDSPGARRCVDGRRDPAAPQP
jgi:hypothetical protein